MSLYKYVTAERLDVLSNLQIRFTRPSAQNDPFEFRPLVSRFWSPQVARKQLSQLWDRKVSEALSQTNPEAQRLRAIVERFPADLASFKETRLAAVDQPIDEEARTEIFKRLDSLGGILSLSEVPDSFYMWCRYAQGYCGFAFEFDDRHPWFRARTDDKDDTHELRKVSYVDVPSSAYLAELDVHEVLYSKRTVWACEREWRIIRPFVESSAQIGKDVYLFSMPATALTGIIVGSWATDDSIQKLARILNENRELRHVRIGCADCDPAKQSVDIFWANSVGEIQENRPISTLKV
jgi:hypothetical protein